MNQDAMKLHQLKHTDDARSTSDGSSPIRPVVRKSSLNFASLPAREPLAAGKSSGARVSRSSHLDHGRASYYNRQTGGKSIGGTLMKSNREEDQEHDLFAEDAAFSQTVTDDNKTYTQRLQDQINMLGQSQSKTAIFTQQSKTPAPKTASPLPLKTLQSTPGAFPQDDDDDWIEPPATVGLAADDRPSFSKSHSAVVVEGIQGKKTIGQTDFVFSDNESAGAAEVCVQDRVVKQSYGDEKLASVPGIPIMDRTDEEPQLHKNVASFAKPGLMTVAEISGFDTQLRSPSRSVRESPLRQVKNKLSSILKSSRGLLASSAAISAEGKSLMSPSSARLGLHSIMSSESIATKQGLGLQIPQNTAVEAESSPSRTTRRTRASAEREREEKKREKEIKRLEEQNEKLEKMREKEREKARVFSKEQEKLAAMEKQIAFQKDYTPLSAQETLTSTKALDEETVSIDKDVDMDDASSAPAPSASHSGVRTHVVRSKEFKRPVKPTRETQNRTKQAPTVIRVNTGSQHSQYRLSTAQPDTSSSSSSQSSHQVSSKVGKASLPPKPSTQSLRSAAATSRVKAQELAAKKKEQEEREAQRRRDAKAEIERKKAAAQEEQRKHDQLKRQEVERQRQQQQEQAASQAQNKCGAQRKAAIEKAKQTRAPPPAVRSQPNGPPDFSTFDDPALSRPPSRPTSNAPWTQDEPGRPVNAVLSNAGKSGAKRPLTQDKGDETQYKQPQTRGGAAYQSNDAKRRRTSEPADEETDGSSQRNIRGPPVRPSAAFKKELPSKSIFQAGYTNAPQSNAPNLFKGPVHAYSSAQMKGVHPLDMAQISKGAIPFAPNPNAAGLAHKTPARPGPAANGGKSAAKSVPRSSPRFQNGETIELPEIQTDDDSEDDESNGVTVAPWADSPDLRMALMRQETMDPSRIFGPPAPLNMEEVFNKSKDRFHKFRARTSSANWSGADRLTEEEVRKDLIARDKLRRDGGWSYEMSRDML
ncbi:hypothetical protein UVI_02036780 [Ustilaginoidea virens]|uniref:Inner centromere protein ARK-binding domain-containing protein n=1 Tax=Ustilaginoidea virens TaxID=1159556 RepID=A0A1B5L3R4_USTVR|nr:hypothetical protein UVI_02036780 [Ustilaginoidea virens]